MSEGILFLLAGTTGDVLPGVTLAARLNEREPVTVATHEPFRAQVEQLGMTFRPLPGSHAELFTTPTGRLLKSTHGRSFNHGLGTALLLREIQPALFDAIETLEVERRRLIVYSPLCVQAQYFADKAGVPAVALHYQTAFPTGAHGSPYVSAPSSRFPLANRLSFELSLLLEDTLISPKARAAGAERDVELPKRHALLAGAWERAALHLQAVSPWLTSEVPVSRFGEKRTGFLPVPPSAFKPLPEAVVAAKESGKRLVYFGMGSLSLSGSERVAKKLEQEVLRRDAVFLVDRTPAADSRAIATAGVDHAQLFELCDVVVIAGGAGTVSTALRASSPLIVLPHWFDQFTWLYLLQRRGLAAPDTPPSGRWSSAIARGLDWAFSAETEARASEAGRILRAEDGVSLGADAVLELLDAA